MVFITFLVFRY